MGRTAMSKLNDADELNKKATNIRKRDPDAARALDDLASGKRRSAIRQMKRGGKKRKRASRAVL